MPTQTILEQLQARAYATDGAARGDALADLVNWIALRASRLDENDMAVLMSAALALYKVEIEKNWEVSPADMPDGPGPAEPAGAAHERDGRAPTDVPARAHPDARNTVAEEAIAALVALRRPAAAAALARDAAPRGGRRWTDTGHWALTLR